MIVVRAITWIDRRTEPRKVHDQPSAATAPPASSQGVLQALDGHWCGVHALDGDEIVVCERH